MFPPAVRPVSDEALAAAERRQLQLTKPPGSLGRLEEIGNRLAALAGECPPPVPAPALVGVFAGDHGVHAQGVTPWPQEITVQMASAIAAGVAAVSVLARDAGADVRVFDVGMATPCEAPGVIERRVRAGTDDIAVGPALSRAEAEAAVRVGLDAARAAVADGYRCLLTGEVGLANTTVAAALVAAFTGSDPARVTGRGAGADDAMLAKKIEVVRRALEVNRPEAADPIGVLAGVGGLEHAALTGFILGGAEAGVPMILDGVIACSAALAAVALVPATRDYLIAGHLGAEAGIGIALEALGLRPLLALDMRLGEGSGAVAALPLVRSAALVLRDMATFDSAGVAGGPAG